MPEPARPARRTRTGRRDSPRKRPIRHRPDLSARRAANPSCTSPSRSRAADRRISGSRGPTEARPLPSRRGPPALAEASGRASGGRMAATGGGRGGRRRRRRRGCGSSLASGRRSRGGGSTARRWCTLTRRSTQASLGTHTHTQRDTHTHTHIDTHRHTHTHTHTHTDASSLERKTATCRTSSHSLACCPSIISMPLPFNYLLTPVPQAFGIDAPRRRVCGARAQTPKPAH